MEPSQKPGKINYVVYAPVEKVEKVGDNYFVQFCGSRESLILGPGFAKGDMVKITFEKQEPTDAQSIGSPK